MEGKKVLEKTARLVRTTQRNGQQEVEKDISMQETDKWRSISAKLQWGGEQG